MADTGFCEHALLSRTKDLLRGTNACEKFLRSGRDTDREI